MRLSPERPPARSFRSHHPDCRCAPPLAPYKIGSEKNRPKGCDILLTASPCVIPYICCAWRSPTCYPIWAPKDLLVRTVTEKSCFFFFLRNDIQHAQQCPSVPILGSCCHSARQKQLPHFIPILEATQGFYIHEDI